MRIVVMLTDGYIGNEAEIIEHVGKNCGDQVRFWCVGIGQSPNMFLVDGVAKQGGGMGKKLGLRRRRELARSRSDDAHPTGAVGEGEDRLGRAAMSWKPIPPRFRSYGLAGR